MTSWHLLSSEEAIETLDSDPRGLDEAEAVERRAQHGANEVAVDAAPSALRRFARQFNNVLLYVLLAAAVVTATLEQWVDTGVILGVVIINAIIGFLQEGRAEHALASIRRLLAPRATVLRGGRPSDIDARLLVPGDVVLLGAGDRVPADARLIQVRNLAVDESLLTGESQSVGKTVAPLEQEVPVSDRANLTFAGTLVIRGQARAVVVTTGAETEIGRISTMLRSVEALTTPLLGKIARFGRVLAAIILGMSAVIGGYGVIMHGLPLADMMVAAVSISVAAIPEGLPPVITITLAIGVQLMARRQAIVRRLPAVETLGEVNIVCTDKTGTLTQNEMTIRTVIADGLTVEVSGVGYRPRGLFLVDGEAIAPDVPALARLLVAGAACNDARLVAENGVWGVVGDPMEGALLSVAGKAGLDSERSGLTRIDAIPFESERRFMATLHREAAGGRCIFVKGAPETVLAMCAGEDRTSSQRADELAASGLRVLALAECRVDEPLRELTEAAFHGRLTMLGLVGINDPPRAEVREAVAACRSAGVAVKIVTGDHASTAEAVAREIGLAEHPAVITGVELDALSAADFERAARDNDVFARVSPQHKLQLVETLQRNGQIVAMTGDGVNDAPALKRADVGIAMGVKGTEVARQAAEIVLADDNFATIVSAVRQGRAIYDNIRKSIVFLLPTSVAEALVIAVAIVVGAELPMTPAQILWVNMITAVTLGIALAFEPAEGDVMARTPRAAQEPILTGFAIWRTAFVGVLMLAGVTVLYMIERDAGASIEYARTVAVNVLVTFEAVYLLSSRRLHRTVLTRGGLTGNRIALASVGGVLVLQLAFTYLPPLTTAFSTLPTSPESWLRIALAGVALFLLVELEKVLRVSRRRGEPVRG